MSASETTTETRSAGASARRTAGSPSASLLNLAVGALTLIWSGNEISELALLYLIGTYAVAFGVIAIGGASGCR